MMPTILFVDDQPGIRQFCKQELKTVGYRVELASDGVEALDVLDSRYIDLVILDEHMHRCNGLEAARYIKQWHPHIPVILFTADEDYDRFTSPLVDGAIIKSEDLGSIKAKIAELLPSETAATLT